MDTEAQRQLLENSGKDGPDPASDSAEELEESIPAGPTPLAQRVRRLKTAVTGAIQKRERLPQPLFWSLFRSEVYDLRKEREKKRALLKAFYNPE